MGFQTPEWVKDAVFYQIFPDRFAKSEQVPKPNNLEPWDNPPTRYGFKGGDLRGVLERLDYLQDLGVNAIYFNPIFQSTANHRYHTHDYYRIDPILGGDEAFRDLLDEAHRRGIRIVLDGVFNHASRGFFQFNHILENGPASPYLDWFIVKGFPLYAYATHRRPNYQAWWGLRALPKLNTDNPQVREFIMGVAEHWLREGIDGWRLDVPLEIKTPGFWEEFRRRVKAINPEAYIVAEIWDGAAPWLQGEHFDAVMNYVFARAVWGFCGGPMLDTAFRPGGFRLRPLSGTEFADEIDRLLALYPWEATLAQLNLLGSHDTPRVLTLFRGDRRRLRLAVLVQMTFPGAPCIYYGDEIGMEGGDDPDCRRSFPWDRSRWDADLRDWVRRCVGLRHRYPALRRGAFYRLWADQSVYAFARALPPDPPLVVAVNAGETPAEVRVSLALSGAGPLAADGLWTDLLSGQSFPAADGVLCLALPPLSGVVVERGP
ncbi:MAG: glycoside hydrolase family 13 protein [Anaerolineae bacterium]|nr:glycoside hydrolase family 13 protein [Anaerolineae bacterium]MDW8068124.1 glycoside hydrolase family 13 protein [Anaerolineae bacterium]